MELDCFPLIKFTVYTNSITSSPVPVVAGGAKVTYTHPSPGCREPGACEITSHPEPNGWQELLAVRGGLLGGRCLHPGPHSPSTQGGREPGGRTGVHYSRGLCSALQVHGKLCFLLEPREIGSVQGQEKQWALLTPKTCYLSLLKSSLYQCGAAREGKKAQRG